MAEVTYDRPVGAKLMVALDNGETWEATPEDLARWRLVDRHTAYMGFRRALDSALAAYDYRDLTDAELNPIRYLAELCILMPDQMAEEIVEYLPTIADLEARLRREREDREAVQGAMS